MRKLLIGFGIFSVMFGLYWSFGQIGVLTEAEHLDRNVRGPIFLFGGISTIIGARLLEQQKATQEKLDQMITSLTAIHQQNKNT